jgi:ubiquinol-cytochrome c reductase cytochrome b subunit
MVLVVGGMEILVFLFPFLLGDPENFILANPMRTPTHIVPEWYFLFAYAILRSIPDKLIGVVFLALSILILFLPPITNRNRGGISFQPKTQALFFFFIGVFFILTWLGGQVVEAPFILLGQVSLVVFFLNFGVLLGGELP